jgi:hypothetical protein
MSEGLKVGTAGGPAVAAPFDRFDRLTAGGLRVICSANQRAVLAERAHGGRGSRHGRTVAAEPLRCAGGGRLHVRSCGWADGT